LNIFKKSPNNTDDFSIRQWFCPYRTTINSAIEKWKVLELSEKYRHNFLSVIPFIIDMINSVHSLLTNLPMDFTYGINSVGNFVGKNNTSSFYFLLCFNLFFTVILLIFPFLFIDFQWQEVIYWWAILGYIRSNAASPRQKDHSLSLDTI